MAPGGAVPLLVSLLGLLAQLAIIARFLSKPDRVPVANTQYFIDAWHLPTLAFLVSGLLLLLVGCGVWLYAWALGSIWGGPASAFYLSLGVFILEGVAPRLAVSISLSGPAALEPAGSVRAWRPLAGRDSQT